MQETFFFFLVDGLMEREKASVVGGGEGTPGDQGGIHNPQGGPI